MQKIMKKLIILLCSAIALTGISDDKNLASELHIPNWRFNGVRPERTLSMSNLKPFGKDKVVNIDYTFPQPFDASGHESFQLRIKITPSKKTACRIKINFYSKNGYLYSRVMLVRQPSEWEDFEFIYQTNAKLTPAARNDFDPSQISRVRIVVLTEDTENIAVDITKATFGEKIKQNSAQIMKDLETIGNRPVVSSAFTDKPPVIDGRLDDECWRTTICMNNFYSNQGGLSREQTEVRLCHDKQNLYIGIKAYADVLNPVNNLLHEFKEAVTEHDGPTYNDDCIELFFSGKSGQYGQIVANLHTTFERIVSASGSDASWNPSLQLKGDKQIGTNGYYSLELTIPLTELERFKDDQGLLTFNAARQNRYLNEMSNWSRASSFHHPNKYAELVFGKTLPGLVFSKSTLPGVNYECEGIFGNNFRLALQVIHSPNSSELQFSPALPGHHVFSVAGNATSFLYSLLVLSDDKIIYRSPIENFGAGLAVASGKTDGNAIVYVNGQPVNETKKFSLVKGKNTIAVKLSDSPQLNIQIDGQEPLILDSSWKFSAVAPDGWHRPGFNDSTWTSFDGKLISPGYLRKAILVETSRFYPLLDKENSLRAPQGAVQPFSLIVNGLSGEELHDYRFYLELPEHVEFVGASGQISRHFGGAARCRWQKVKNIVRSGENYIRYEVKFSGNTRGKPGIIQYIPPKKLYAWDMIVLALKTNTFQDFNCYYYAEANGGNYTELERSFTVRVLPRLNAATPSRMRMVTWFSFRNLDDRELQLKIYREHAQAGFNIANANSGMGDVVKATGMKYCSRFNFEVNGFAPTSVLGKHPSIRFIDYKGTVHSYKVPFYHIVHNDDFRKELGTALRQYLLTIKPDILDWDFEFDTFTGFYTSYDPDTLNFFRKKHNISDELNPQLIQEKYAEEWIEFMTQLTGEVFRFIHEITASLGIEWDVYSGYPSPYTRARYGINYEYVLPNVDFAMMGYGRPMKEIQEIRKLSKKINRPVLFGICARPYFLYQIAPQQPITSAQVLRLVLDCGYGAMYWGHYCSDGELLHSFNEINRLLAVYEDFILDGVCIPSESIGGFSGINPDNIAVYRHNGKTLIFFLNLDKNPKSINIQLKIPFSPKIKEFYSEKNLNPIDGKLSLSLEGGCVATIIME